MQVRRPRLGSPSVLRRRAARTHCAGHKKQTGCWFGAWHRCSQPGSSGVGGMSPPLLLPSSRVSAPCASRRGFTGPRRKYSLRVKHTYVLQAKLFHHDFWKKSMQHLASGPATYSTCCTFTSSFRPRFGCPRTHAASLNNRCCLTCVPLTVWH